MGFIIFLQDTPGSPVGQPGATNMKPLPGYFWERILARACRDTSKMKCPGINGGE